MRRFYHDTQFEVYDVTLTKDSGGAHVENETFTGEYMGKFDYLTGKYAITNRELSDQVTAMIIANDLPIKSGDIVIVATSRRFRVDSVDRSTLRTRLAHIEIFLSKEND